MAFVKKTEQVIVKEANIVRLDLPIEGTAPLVIHRFAKKVMLEMLKSQTLALADKPTKKQRAQRVPEQEFVEAQYISEEGWCGIPCSAFRSAMIAACRVCGLVMTQTKMTVFVVADGVDKEDGIPLTRIISEAGPEMVMHPVRLESGVASVAIRPMWKKWNAIVRVSFDADQISATSVVNLLDRAGKQVGIMEGRPFSTNSTGMGWGTFRIVDEALQREAA
jgi:hypothetical protein